MGKTLASAEPPEPLAGTPDRTHLDGTAEPVRPLLAMDLDGVLNASGWQAHRAARDGDLRLERRFRVGADFILVPDGTTERVAALERRFEVVWATGWRSRAREEVAPKLGFGARWPVIDFAIPTRESPMDWKLAELLDYAAGRPLAFVDDFVTWDAFRAIENRERTGVPSLVLRPLFAAGLTDRHVDELVAFADRVGAPDVDPGPADAAATRGQGGVSRRSGPSSLPVAGGPGRWVDGPTFGRPPWQWDPRPLEAGEAERLDRLGRVLGAIAETVDPDHPEPKTGGGRRRRLYKLLRELAGAEEEAGGVAGGLRVLVEHGGLLYRLSTGPDSDWVPDRDARRLRARAREVAQDVAAHRLRDPDHAVREVIDALRDQPRIATADLLGTSISTVSRLRAGGLPAARHHRRAVVAALVVYALRARGAADDLARWVQTPDEPVGGLRPSAILDRLQVNEVGVLIGEARGTPGPTLTDAVREHEHELQYVAHVFGLDDEGLAGLFGVTAAELRPWARPGPPAEVAAKLQHVVAIADLVDLKVRHERRASVVRRPADALAGRSILEAIADDDHEATERTLRSAFRWEDPA